MVDLLAGLLSDASYLTHVNSWVDQPQLGQGIGHFFIVVDAARLGPPRWLAERMDDFAAIVHETERVDAAQPVLLPGEIEMAHLRRQRRDGIAIDQALLAMLDACARRAA
jgi:LDH2 family malate/lactate/ureidoglycolate dehydrogenase